MGSLPDYCFGPNFLFWFWGFSQTRACWIRQNGSGIESCSFYHRDSIEYEEEAEEVNL